jgi:predicted deacylase
MRTAALVLCGLAAATAANAQGFTVGSVTAQPGTLASGELVIDASARDTGTRIPFSIIHGSRPGPVLALVAGVHGQEYTPILALQRLRTAIDPATLTGTIIMVHVANMPSFTGRTIYYSPVDRKNLNRVFPGRADGTLSERIADRITREVIQRATHVVDLHAGDGNESLRPYVYWINTGTPDVVEMGRRMALASGFDHIVIDRSRPTDAAASVYLSNTAITRGKPALTVESGFLAVSDEASIVRLERAVGGWLKLLGMRATGPDPVEHPIWIDRNEVLTSRHTGIWYPLVERGQTVAQGTLIGRVTDFFGNTLQEIRSPFAGDVLYVVGTPAMNEGEPVGFIGQVSSNPQIPKPRAESPEPDE